MTSDTPAIRRINPPELSTPPGYSQIVEVSAGRIVFIAGQTAADRDGNVVGRGDFSAQAEQVFSNLAMALTASGCTAANLVKLTVFLTNIGNLGRYRDARNRLRDAAGRAGGDAGRGVKTLSSRFYDRDRGHRRGVKFALSRKTRATSSSRRAEPCRG